MQRKPLPLSGSLFDVVCYFCEGNPGCLSAIAQLQELVGQDVIPMYLLHLDDMNIRGPQAWSLFKNYCEQDPARFRDAIRSRDRKGVKIVNDNSGSAWLAIEGGASFMEDRPMRKKGRVV